LQRWPDEGRAGVCLTCDIDRGDDVTEGRLERILNLLDDQRIKATFFIPADVISQDPTIATAVLAQGSEISGHGDTHREYKGQTYREQLSRISRMAEIIQDIADIRVKGFRAPRLYEDANTIKAANDLGLSYDSSITCREAWRWSHFERLQENVRDHRIRSFLSRVKVLDGPSVPNRVRPFAEILYEVCFGCQAKDYPFYSIVDRKRLKILEIPMSNRDDHQLIRIWPRYHGWRRLAQAWREDFIHRYERNGLHVLLFHVQLTGTVEYRGSS